MSALSTTARHDYHFELGNALPPPVNPAPEYRQSRHTTAIETFTALGPGDAYEASLAVRIVLAGAHAVECLRQAGVHHEDFAKMMRWHARAASFMREERAAKRMLAQEQKVRLAVEAVASAAPAHPAPAPAPSPQAEPHAPPPVQSAETAPPPVPEPAATPPRPAITNATIMQQKAAASAPSPSPEAIAQAEEFAQEHLGAAAQIRHERGVTPHIKAQFHYLPLPADPAVIDALVRGQSDLLDVLDEIGGEDLDEAA